MNDMEQAFDGKTLLITGGTGSFGNAVLKRFLSSPLAEIRIFSRDEKKQDEMRRQYKDPKIRFFIGDVRDSRSIKAAMAGVDFVFHAAALKQVPSCEFYPIEAVKTNVLGTSNVLDEAITAGVKRVIVLSTDKAVYPINAMGMSKALMEKTAIATSREAAETVINITRYGNVMASRGSVIPLFARQIRDKKPITITDPNMTRFMMTLASAVDLVMYAFVNGTPGDLFVQKAPAATIDVLARALAERLNSNEHTRVTLGTRHGEKLFESLLTREERVKARDVEDYFIVPADLRDLNYDKFFDVGGIMDETAEDYTSHNTTRLDEQGMLAMLEQLTEEELFGERQ